MNKKTIFAVITLLASLLLFPWWHWMFSNGFIPEFQGSYALAAILTTTLISIVVWNMVKGIKDKKPEGYNKEYRQARWQNREKENMPPFRCGMYILIESNSGIIPLSEGVHYCIWEPYHQLLAELPADNDVMGRLSWGRDNQHWVYSNRLKDFTLFDAVGVL